MGFNLGASRNRSSENNWSNFSRNESTDMNQSRTGNRRAQFGPEASGTLSFLQGETTSNPYREQAGSALTALASDQGEVNPNVEQIIQTGDIAAERGMNNALAKTRAAGYRGGTGTNVYAQDKLIADTINTRENNNANLRYGAFEDAQSRGLTSRLAGASGLAGMSGQQQSLATQLLSLLRGEDVQDNVTGRTNTIATGAQTGGSSGKQSGTSANIGWGKL